MPSCVRSTPTIKKIRNANGRVDIDCVLHHHVCRSTTLLVSIKKWWFCILVFHYFYFNVKIMKIAMCGVDSHRSLVQCQCSSACGTDRWCSNVCTHLFDAVLHSSRRGSTTILPSQKHVCLALFWGVKTLLYELLSL